MSTKVHLIYSTQCGISREPTSDDEWDRGNTWTSWDVKGAKLSRGYPSVEYEGDLKPGDIVHLLYAVYSTGNSFGSDENGSIDFISVHKNHDVAFANRQVLEKFLNTEFGLDAVLKTDDGQEFKYYVPWLGYFESLSYIDIHSCVLQGE